MELNNIHVSTEIPMTMIQMKQTTPALQNPRKIKMNQIATEPWTLSEYNRNFVSQITLMRHQEEKEKSLKAAKIDKIR